ncbi:MAG: hypothetical protein ACYCZO_12980 [Daejeonella sp.]
MKNSLKILSAIVLSAAVSACNSNPDQGTVTDSTSSMESSSMSMQTEPKVIPGSYTELNTGKTVYIVSDPQTGWAIDSITRVPVEFYTNNSGDTLFQTGLVVNQAIMQSDGKWMLDETKIKRDGDKIKIKYEDGSKMKMDGEELKIKGEEGKVKVDKDTTKVKLKN